jgi:CHC2 zinc finger
VKDSQKIADLIIQTVDFAQVMLQYGVRFMFDPLRASEVQLRCPFHGKDNKPSARYYRSTQSMYCWKCCKKWDVITFIRDKEGFKYGETLHYIVNRFGVDLSSIPDEPLPSETNKFESEAKSDTKSVSDAAVLIKVQNNLQHDLRGKIAFEKYRALCTVLVSSRFAMSQGVDVLETAIKLENKIKGVLHAGD